MGFAETLKHQIKALAFDQYGTVVDMRKGLVEAVAPLLEQKGWDGEPNRFVTWWRRTHFENSMIDSLCDRGRRPFDRTPHQPDLIVANFDELALALA